MRRQSLLSVSVLCAVLAASCTREAEPAPEPPVEPGPAQPLPSTIPAVSYACESGATVTVRYADNQTAEVTYQTQTRAMRIVQSASGARYTGEGLEWWTATRGGQEGATLSRLGPNQDVGVAILERCSRPAGSDPLAPAAPDPSRPQPIDGVPACLGPNLRLAREGGDAGAGNRVMVMSLTNIGSAPCYLNGYPKVQLFNAQGAALSQVASEDTPSNYFRPNEQPTPVVLAPQARGWFDIAHSAVPNEAIGETTCPSATRMRVTAPGDTAGVPLDIQMQPCGRRLRVSPIRSAQEPQRPASVAPPTSST